MSAIGSRKSLNRRHSEKRLSLALGGRLASLVSPMSISATRRAAARPVKGCPPMRPTRSPPRARSSASASASTTARLSLETLASEERNRIDGERSTQSQTVCAASHSRSRTKRWSELAERRQSMPVTRVVLIVMPELPEGLAGTGAAAAMRAVGDGVGDALRLDQERRHARRQAMGFGFLARKWLKHFLSRVTAKLRLTLAARQASPPCGSCRRLRHERRR